MNKTIKEIETMELKAIAYDQLATIEQAQNNLKAINQELASRNQPQMPEVPNDIPAKVPEDFPTSSVGGTSTDSAK